jgi:hypothetical protein
MQDRFDSATCGGGRLIEWTDSNRKSSRLGFLERHCRASQAGSMNETLAPSPGVLSAQIFPP